jgi:hypothetical protein
MGKAKVYRGGWTPERDDELRAMWATELFIREIAARMGKSTAAIAKHAQNLNLPARQVTATIKGVYKEVGWRNSFVIKSRACLKCRKQFQSNGNFICIPCSANNRELSPLAEGYSA